MRSKVEARVVELIGGLSGSRRAKVDSASSLGEFLDSAISLKLAATIVASLLETLQRERNKRVIDELLYAVNRASARPVSVLELAPLEPLIAVLPRLSRDQLLEALSIIGSSHQIKYRAALKPYLTHRNGYIREYAKEASDEINCSAKR